MKFEIDKQVFEKFPDLVEAVVIVYGFDNTKSSEESVVYLHEQEKTLRDMFNLDGLLKDEPIVSYRETFRKFGMDIEKYDPSHFALSKRVIEGNDLPDINPVVNIYNGCSIKFLTPFGGENLDQVYGDMVLKFAKGTEEWWAIGATKNKPPIPGEMVWIDDKDVTCRAWNWRQCDRTKLTNESKNGYFIMDGFESNRDNIEKAAKEFIKVTTDLLGGKGELYWLDKDHPEIKIEFKSKKYVEEKKVEPKKTERVLPPKESVTYKLMKLVAKASGADINLVNVDHPADSQFGDYSTNIALTLAKTEKKNPREVAEEIKNKIELGDLVEKVGVAGAGFINFYLKTEFLVRKAEELNYEIELRERLSKYGNGKKVIVEYSSPNIAKPFGIGHLRSTNIGQALYNIYRMLGWACIGDNHLGDWGTQFGKMITAIKRWADKPVTEMSVEDLEKLYVKFHAEAEAETDESLNEEGQQWFAKLENGDKEAKEIWQMCVDVSLQEFNRVYDLLNVHIDNAHGEAFYENMLKEIVDEMKKKGLTKESQGALIVELPNMPPAMLLKSDGATTYFTRDMATVKYRLNEWKPDMSIYEVGADQILHFQQVFAASKLMGWEPPLGFVHVAHGMFRWNDGKFSTRRGDTIHLSDVIDKAMEEAKKVAEKSSVNKEMSTEEKEKMIEAVAIGAIKFNDLSQDPKKDIIFDWDRVMNLEGDSGPYLQYTYARCQSVLQKSKIVEQKNIGNIPEKINAEELALLRELTKLEEKVIESATRYNPGVLAEHLLSVARKYNEFYGKHRIINQPEETFRIFLTKSTSSLLHMGLGLLGIKTVEKM